MVGQRSDAARAAIISNAVKFKDRWGIGPMTGWLDTFAALGLLTFENSTLVRLRSPTSDEIEAARQAEDVRF
ncbi:MAG: glycosyl transferase family 2 [Brevundimonas sp.]|nr:glycosyl transferase family 2 [Brevundimonas sp.]